MEAQSLVSGDIGPQCLQNDNSYSLDTFGDIDVLIADLPDFEAMPPCMTKCLQNSKVKVFQE